MAGDVERRARLARIGAVEVGRPVDAAGRVHRAGAEQHVDLAEGRLDLGDHLQPPALRLHVVAGVHEGAGHQAAARELAVVARPLAQPRTVDRPGLALQDDAVDRAELGERRQADVAHLGALHLQGARDMGQRCRDLGLGRRVDLVEMAHEADAQIAHAAIEVGGIVAVHRGRAAGIEGVVAGDRLQHQRIVGDGARHRADMVQGEGQRKDAAARHQSIGRLQPDDAAAARGIAHAAAGVGAQRHREQAGRHARARARRRAAGMMVGVPGIARRRPRQVEARPADGELVRRELAHDDGAGAAQLLHADGVGLGDVVRRGSWNGRSWPGPRH